MPPARESGTPVRGIPTEGMEHNQVSIGVSPTQIVAQRLGRRALLLIQHGIVDVFVGGAAVTVSNGVLLAGTKGQGLVIPYDGAVFGVVASGSQTVSFVELF